MHSLLTRQLRKQFGSETAVPENLQPLLRAVDEAYHQFDEDRVMLERSLDLSSQELLQANMEMRAVFGMLPDLLFRLDMEGHILDCNTGSLELLMMRRENLVGRRIQDVPLPMVRRQFEDALARVRSSQGAASIEYAMTTHGLQRFFEAHLLPLQGRQIIVFVRDITSRWSAEREWRRLAAAVDQATECIFITDIAGSIEYVNPAFETVTGYRSHEVMGQNPRILNAGQQGDAVYIAMWENLAVGQPWNGRFINRRKDGTLFEMDTTITPLRDPDGRIVNFVAVGRDVSREVELEDKLRQSQKMEAIGRLAGGIAHDFNNILTAILGNTDLLFYKLAERDPLRREIEEIRKAAQRAASLTNQLLAFGRRQVLHLRVISLNAVVLELSRMLHRVLGENIELITDLPQGLGPIRADPVQMEQVLLNLALNARDAMPGGGRLRIETANVEVSEEEAGRWGDIKPGAYVSLSVTDSGVGMDAATKTHLFEPFFTTKGVGRGTGLGLATVYGIVKQIGGHIAVYSEVAQGSCFRVYLPRVSGDADADPSPRVSQPTLQGHESILLVEDELPIRRLTAMILEKHGYQVTEAANGRQALEIMSQHTGTFHLVLTDVIMPVMSGDALARELAAHRPGTRVLFMSGHPDSAIVDTGVLKPGTAFLKKPFTSADLARKVREVLDAT